MLRRILLPTTVCIAALATTAGTGLAGQRPQSPGGALFASATNPHDAGLALARATRTWRRGHARKPSDLSALLRQIAQQLPALRGSQQREAARLLERPTDGGSDPQQNGYSVHEATPYCSAHFCIHYVTSSADAPNLSSSNGSGVPDYVQSVANVAENVYSVEVGTLAWRAPKSDGALGGGLGKTDIYLKNLGGTGVYGYTAPDPGQLQGHSLYAYNVIDSSFDKAKFPTYSSPLIPLEVTLAHEFNHVLHFNYDALEDTWMFESTAVWMEGRVYPAAHDYLQYMPGWVSLTEVPLTTFDGANPNDRHNVKVYGSAVWNKWLDARYGPAVVRDAWADSTLVRPQSFAPAAYDSSIRQHGGRGLSDEFDRFSAATAEWGAQGSGFPEGSLYPQVARIGSLPVNARGGIAKLNHTTFSLISVPPTAAPRVKLVVSAPAGTSAALALVGRNGPAVGGSVVSELAELPRGGRGSVTLANPSAFSRLTAVLVNSDFSQQGFSRTVGDWLFRRDAQSYVARMTTDFTAPRLRTRSPRPGGRTGTRPTISVVFSKAVLGTGGHAVELLGARGRRIPIRIRLTHGSRNLILVPRRALASGSRYRIELRGSITDTDLNALRPMSWTFIVR